MRLSTVFNQYRSGPHRVYVACVYAFRQLIQQHTHRHSCTRIDLCICLILLYSLPESRRTHIYIIGLSLIVNDVFGFHVYNLLMVVGVMVWHI